MSGFFVFTLGSFFGYFRNLRCLPISSCSFKKELRYFNYICGFQGTYFFGFISQMRIKTVFIPSSLVNVLFLIWRPPALPHRLQCSTIGRPGLNHRVRDGNGCVPRAHRHQKFRVLDNSTVKHILSSTSSSLERR